MTRKSIWLISLLFVVATTSCKMKAEIRSYNEMLSHAGNGDVSTTLSRMDSIKRFRNPLVNLKYQKLKRKYYARFVTHTEKRDDRSKNQVMNDICRFYEKYWNSKLIESPLNSDSILYDNLAHYLIDNQLTELNSDELSSNIKDDSELTKVIENEGFHCRFFLINGIQDVVIWDQQSSSNYDVGLPEMTINVDVVFIENYLLKGASDYATFGFSQIGGWASNEDTSLFCNKGTYQLNSEKFQNSYLKHESVHFVDIQKYPNLESADLEYRAKLIELIYCSEKTIYQRIDEFILSASDENRENAHPYANHFVIAQLSKKLFRSEFESDISKWKSLTAEEINTASRQLFDVGTQILEEDITVNRIIEVIQNQN